MLFLRYFVVLDYQITQITTKICPRHGVSDSYVTLELFFESVEFPKYQEVS